MTEHEQAVQLANRILDQPGRDPDDDLSLLSRQFLRSIERAAPQENRVTRNQLEAVVNGLVTIVDSWNEAAADEDRGRSNDAICLTLWDDGSGRIGCRRWGGELEDWHEFDTIDRLAQLLRDEGLETDA